jgi:transaldolase
VQLQSWGSGVQKLSSNAFDLAGIDPKRVVVKLPCTYDGIQTAALLAESHIRVTITGIYSAHQVLLAEAVGAEYAAPYLGRMNDAYGAGKVGGAEEGMKGMGWTAVAVCASLRSPHPSLVSTLSPHCPCRALPRWSRCRILSSRTRLSS